MNRVLRVIVVARPRRSKTEVGLFAREQRPMDRPLALRRVLGTSVPRLTIFVAPLHSLATTVLLRLHLILSLVFVRGPPWELEIFI